MSLPKDLNTALKQFISHERILIASDFDGVLAPLVQNPADSRATPGTLEALETLSAQTGVCAAIASGRDLATLRSLTQISESVVLIGSHGAESSESVDLELLLTDEQRDVLDEATSRMSAIAAQFGARIEHKPAGVVLHTRGLPDEQAQAATTAGLGLVALPGSHVMAGKSVVELSVLDVSKGAALTALAHKHDLHATFYMGDDVTDETAFAVLPASGGNVTLKVGSGDTAAAYRIPIEDVVSVLETLVALRTSM